MQWLQLKFALCFGKPRFKLFLWTIKDLKKKKNPSSTLSDEDIFRAPLPAQEPRYKPYSSLLRQAQPAPCLHKFTLPPLTFSFPAPRAKAPAGAEAATQWSLALGGCPHCRERTHPPGRCTEMGFEACCLSADECALLFHGIWQKSQLRE